MTLDQETTVEMILSEEARLIEEEAMIGDGVKTHENARLNLTTAIARLIIRFLFDMGLFQAKNSSKELWGVNQGSVSKYWNLHADSKNGLVQSGETN